MKMTYFALPMIAALLDMSGKYRALSGKDLWEAICIPEDLEIACVEPDEIHMRIRQKD